MVRDPASRRADVARLVAGDHKVVLGRPRHPDELAPPSVPA